MSITFWLEVTKISANDRNIFHVSNDNINCCNKGNRVPGIWILQNLTTLFISNDTIGLPNQTFTVDGINLNNQIFISITWNDKDVYVYFNKNFIKSFTYQQNLVEAIANAYVYIGDQWTEQNEGIKIKNLTLYNYVLSVDQIQQVYNNQNIISNFWEYTLSTNKWYTINNNNLIGKWSTLGINSNANMTISFNILISSVNESFRNIFHVSNNNIDCCDKGNRVP
jgi:hypothetical protein